MKALEIKDLHKSFGGFKVLTDISLSVEPGERRALIGLNGAGKTTLFNIISGLLKPDTGTIIYSGKDITRLPPYKRARLGMARTFQKNNLFSNLSLIDNLKLAQYRALSPIDPYELLQRLGLEDKKRVLAKELSYGDQRQMELLMVLAQSPRIILLDEPTAGMSPAETSQIVRILSSLSRDLTILIIEHDMNVVETLADRVTVMHLGRIFREGSTEEVKSDPKLKQIYLGKVQT